MKKNQSAVALPVLPGAPLAVVGLGHAFAAAPAPPAVGSFRVTNSKLLAWVLHVERGTVTLDATGLHKESVQVEMALRAAAGLTGKGHTKALITSADMANGPKVRKASKPRTRKPVTKVAAEETAAVEATV